MFALPSDVEYYQGTDGVRAPGMAWDGLVRMFEELERAGISTPEQLQECMDIIRRANECVRSANAVKHQAIENHEKSAKT